ncbi:MAG: hypothetical protein GWN18_19005 [Thermoplasmata archaeon]|nr:hypothetical protein [Thermoplasmata archaeon]
MVVLLLVTLPLTSVNGREEGVDFYYRGELERLDKGLGPGTAGAPVRMMYDKTGERVLIQGREGVDDLRVLDNDLNTLAVLEPPYEDFHVSGAIMSWYGERVITWGRTPFNSTDVVVTYNLTHFEPEPGYLPTGTIPLVEIDHINLMGDGIILVVGGRDGNGTNRLLFIETTTKREMKNDTIPGNREVMYIGHDGVKMIVALEGGMVLVYQTRDWGFETSFQVFDDAFTAIDIKPRTDWFFGNADGDVVGFTFYAHMEFQNMTMKRGPVQGIYSVERFRHQAVASPGEGSGSLLTVWMYNGEGWVIESSSMTDRPVTSLVGDPMHDTTFAACLDDGSIEFYMIVLVEEELEPPKETWWEKHWMNAVMIGILILAALVLLVLVRGRKADGD